MEVMSATQFRSNLFKALKKVLMGFEIKVKTRDANVLLVNEKKYSGRIILECIQNKGKNQ